MCTSRLGARLSARLRARRAAGGFTLIEALAAIVILALSLSALLSAHDAGVRGAVAIDGHLQARLLAQSLLAQWSRYRAVPAAAQGPSKGASQGRFQGHSGRFAWTVSIQPWEGAGGTLHNGPQHWLLHDITVTVAWPPGREVKLNTLRLLHAQ